MTTLAKSKQSDALYTLKLGDRVRIKNYAGKLGKIVELRGASVRTVPRSTASR